MVTLEENWIKISENFVPLVSIYRFNSFLQELRKNLSYFRTFKISKLSFQPVILMIFVGELSNTILFFITAIVAPPVETYQEIKHRIINRRNKDES